MHSEFNSLHMHEKFHRKVLGETMHIYLQSGLDRIRMELFPIDIGISVSEALIDNDLIPEMLIAVQDVLTDRTFDEFCEYTNKINFDVQRRAYSVSPIGKHRMNEAVRYAWKE